MKGSPTERSVGRTRKTGNELKRSRWGIGSVPMVVSDLLGCIDTCEPKGRRDFEKVGGKKGFYR